MASQVVQVAVGQLDIIDQGTFKGVDLIDVAGSAIADDPGVQAGLSHTREHMEYMTGLVGRYPFENYGVLAADELFGYALETQTLSLHPGFLVDETQVAPIDAEPILVHELAHQWFGDDIAPAEWSDVWLNEGHATWYEAQYADDKFGVSFVDRMHGAYEVGNQYRPTSGRSPGRRATTSSTCSRTTSTTAARSCCTRSTTGSGSGSSTSSSVSGRSASAASPRPRSTSSCWRQGRARPGRRAVPRPLAVRRHDPADARPSRLGVPAGDRRARRGSVAR